MKVVSIINLKGGVGKTTTAVSMSELLAGQYHKRILLIDNDKQGNASRLFRHYNPGTPKGTPDMLTTGNPTGNIMETDRPGISLSPCNYYMETSTQTLRDDRTGRQHDRYRMALGKVESSFDFCIIDNPPDLGLNVVNALVASHEVIIPVNLDNYSLDGLEMLAGQVERIKLLNPQIKLLGCLITNYEKSITSGEAEAWLRESSGLPIFRTRIRHSGRTKDSTFYHQTVIQYSIRSGTAQDYKKLVDEYMGGNNDRI